MSEFTLFFGPHHPNGFLSNWYKAKFQLEGKVFNCTEQWYMYKKAKYFQDQDTAQKILSCENPYQQKKLGRTVKHFNRRQWLKVAPNIMHQGNLAKYSQNPSLKKKLLNTKETILAESSGYDKIWGTGCFPNHKDAKVMTKWPGKNLLGNILMLVRKELQ